MLFILLLSLLACLITHAADKALAGNVSKQIKQKRTRSNNSNNNKCNVAPTSAAIGSKSS